MSADDIHILREASAFCSFYSNGQCEGLIRRNEQKKYGSHAFIFKPIKKPAERARRHIFTVMGFLKNLTDKAKEKVNEVKNNVSKEDFLEIISDYKKTIAEGKPGDELAQTKATINALKGLGKIATGTYKSASDKLEGIHKDPYDIQMAEETKDAINSSLVEALNPRKFIYDSPDVAEEMGLYVVKSMKFVGLCSTKDLLPRINAHFKEIGVHYDEKKLESTINSFVRQKDVSDKIFLREQVDKYIFIDRMTKDEILTLNANFQYNSVKHYKYECEYCRMKFEKAPLTGQLGPQCEFHPLGRFKGPHKVHSIDQEKLWVD